MNRELAGPLYEEAKQLADLVSEEWAESYNTKEGHAEICLRDAATGEIYPIAIIKPDCTYDDRRLMIKAPIILRGLLWLLQESFAEIRRLKPKPVEKPNYAAECAMLCGEAAFRKYLIERHALDVADNERVKRRVCSILRISSRSELNTDPDAADRWKKLRANFKEWRRS